MIFVKTAIEWSGNCGYHGELTEFRLSQGGAREMVVEFKIDGAWEEVEDLEVENDSLRALVKQLLDEQNEPKTTEPKKQKDIGRESEQIMRYFETAHLPEELRKVSEPFCELASMLVEALPRSAERTVALRKLLESKDSAVRAALPPTRGE